MKNFSVVALAAILAACSSEPIGRDNPNSVNIVSSDAFNAGRIVKVVACITDGFKRIPQTVWHNHLTSQEIIEGGYRIEMRGTLGGTLMLSVDVLNSGTAKLYSSTFGTPTTNTLGIFSQKEAAIAEYTKCLSGAPK